MIRRTSIEVYERIKAEGLLSQLRLEVYEVLFKYGPLTAGEAWSRYFPNRQRSSVSARMSELEERKVAYPAFTRVCALTGNRAIAWDVTDRLPVDPPKKEKKPEDSFKRIAELEAENAWLKKELERARAGFLS